MGNENFEIPEREETVSSYYISPYEVTIKEWKEFVEDTNLDFEWNNEYWGDIWDYSESELSPVQYVQWWQAIEYCNWLSRREGLEPVYRIRSQNNVIWNRRKNGYRLPTEVEWEFAARGGNLSQGFLYSGSNDPYEVGWFKENADEVARNVGSRKPNELEIFDMSGNVNEWCWETHYWEPNDNMIRIDRDPLDMHVVRGRAGARTPSTFGNVYFRTSFVYFGRGLVGLRLVRNVDE